MATTVLVKPSSKLSLPLPPPIAIHTLDLVVPTVYAPLYFFFPPASKSAPPVKEIIMNFITAISDLLEHFPLVAGSIRPDSSGKLHVYSDNTGMDFVYELRPERFPGKHAKGMDPRGDGPVLPSPDKTLFALKFTAFACGTYVLCISAHHTLVDLTSKMDFCYALSRQMNNKPHISIPKHWTRDPMSYFPPSTRLLSEIPGLRILPADAAPPPFHLPPPADLVPIYVTNQQLERVKKSNSSSATSFQILAVLLWRASVRICYPEIPDNEPVNLGIAVNGRERSPNKIMSKEHYFGNFNPAVGVSVKKSVLLNGDISVLARVVRDALRTQLTEDYIAAKVNTLQSLPTWRFMPNNHCQLSSWPKDKMLGGDLDFGLVEPGSGKRVEVGSVEVGSGNQMPIPLGNLQDMMIGDDIHMINFVVPFGKRELFMKDAEVLKWGQFTKPETHTPEFEGSVTAHL